MARVAAAPTGENRVPALSGSRQPVQSFPDQGDEFLGMVPEQLVTHDQCRDSPPRCDVPAPPVFLEARPVHVEPGTVRLYAETAIDHQIQMTHARNVDL